MHIGCIWVATNSKSPDVRLFYVLKWPSGGREADGGECEQVLLQSADEPPDVPHGVSAVRVRV